MGTWGFGAFENDDALDWAYELSESDSVDLLEATLRAATEQEYIETPESTMALAGAEVVASLIGNPPGDLPEEVSSWVAENPSFFSDQLRDLAMDAINQISQASELKELWEETDEFPEWQAAIEALIERLTGRA